MTHDYINIKSWSESPFDKLLAIRHSRAAIKTADDNEESLPFSIINHSIFFCVSPMHLIPYSPRFERCFPRSLGWAWKERELEPKFRVA